MFYLNKLGNFLDEIDGSKGDEDTGESESQSTSAATPREVPDAASFIGRTGISGIGGILSSAAAAAGSAATSAAAVAGTAANSAVAVAGSAATKAAVVGGLGAVGSTITSLLREDGDEDDQSLTPEATERNTEVILTPHVPEVQEITGPSGPSSQLLKSELAEASPLPSSQDLAAQGWSLEDSKPAQVFESTNQDRSADATNCPASKVTPSTPVDAGSFVVLSEDQPTSDREVAATNVAEAEADALLSHEPRSPAHSIGTTLSTSGATSEEFTRCEEAASRAEVLGCSSTSLVTVTEEVKTTEASHDVPLAVQSTPQEHDVPAAEAEHDLCLQLETQRIRFEEQLLGATKQISHLQARIEELEVESNSNASTASGLRREVEKLQKQLRDQSTASQLSEEQSRTQLMAAEVTTRALERQVEELKREVAAAKREAREQASKESDATLGQVREEMEKELEHLLKQKDEQVRGLETKLTASERARRDQSREFEKVSAEAESLRAEVEALHTTGAGHAEDHQKTLDTLIADHRRQVEELTSRRDLEERQKHELALNLRSVEERCRSEIEQLEVQKAQLELQFNALQVQLQQEQQKCIDLSVSLGEVQQRFVQLEEGGVETATAAEEARELKDRLRSAEDKLIDAQAMRDMFAKETDMYRSELKVARDDRLRLEDELSRAQDRVRELSTSIAQSTPGAAGQTAVIEAMQKDFDTRMERYRDEVQYLRQKCDEKEKRCEHLMAEKSSLAVELKSGRGLWRDEDTTDDLEAGSKTGAGKATAGTSRSIVRSLPLASPTWIRSADEPCRMVVRTLATVPEARLVFFTYFILLHAWVLFIMQQMAIH